ncbi:hypothetical protein CsSME_00011517 [Camellia sinensis var. sinensis]
MVQTYQEIETLVEFVQVHFPWMWVDDHILSINVIARPGFQRPPGSTSTKSFLEPTPTTEKGLLPAGFVLEDPDSHYVYVCRKMDQTTNLSLHQGMVWFRV